MNLRCFIAVEMPESIKKSIGDIIEILGKAEADVKWVSAENLHITLKFLGQTDESLISPIKDSLHKKIAHYNPSYIKISGAGCFPDTKRPRVIWFGLNGSEFLINLQRDIEQAMTQFGFGKEKRDFSPHLTIGRVKSQKRIPAMIKILDEFRSHDFACVEINSIKLMKSELKPAGAEYYDLAEIPLGGRNDDG